VAKQGSRTRAPSYDVILDVAAQLFEEVGFQQVTMQDLADRIGIAKPTLYVHGRSKTAILEGIFERVMRDGEAALVEAEGLPSPGERIREFLLRWTEVATKIQSHYRVFFNNERDLPAPAARYYRRWSEEVFHRVRDMVADGQRVGAFRTDLDPTVVSFTAMALPNWTARWFTEGQLTPQQIAEQQWELMARGLEPRAGGGSGGGKGRRSRP
jgi:TetR/AcrR family transcriptional regulator, cholesterol catabolism regulator